jgi:hypothetical protein
MPTSYLTSYLVFVDIYDLHQTVEDIQEEDCFDLGGLRRDIKGLMGTYLICHRCPLLCFIQDGEMVKEIELIRSAADLGITPEHLKAIRAGEITRGSRS